MPRATQHGPELTFLRDLPLSREAVEFARERHGEQRRASDGASFLLHPLEAASMLDRASFPDPVVAAAPHDVLEDTNVREAELECRFGPEVSNLVAVVSDDLSIAGEEQRRATCASASAVPEEMRWPCTPPTRCARSANCGR